MYRLISGVKIELRNESNKIEFCKRNRSLENDTDKKEKESQIESLEDNSGVLITNEFELTWGIESLEESDQRNVLDESDKKCVVGKVRTTVEREILHEIKCNDNEPVWVIVEQVTNENLNTLDLPH